MGEILGLGERDEDEELAQSTGSSVILTPEGWEESEYVEPGDDWRLLQDGSFLSPDGKIRSWPLVGARGQ